MHRKSCKLEKHRHLYMWLQKPCWAHIVRAWRFRAFTQKRLHSEICPETDVFCKNYVLNSFVWKWTLLYHVSHHLLGGWLSPGRTYSDLPWIGRWIQVQGGQTKFDRLPWISLVQQVNNTSRKWTLWCMQWHDSHTWVSHSRWGHDVLHLIWNRWESSDITRFQNWSSHDAPRTLASELTSEKPQKPTTARLNHSSVHAIFCQQWARPQAYSGIFRQQVWQHGVSNLVSCTLS